MGTEAKSILSEEEIKQIRDKLSSIKTFENILKNADAKTELSKLQLAAEEVQKELGLKWTQSNKKQGVSKFSSEMLKKILGSSKSTNSNKKSILSGLGIIGCFTSGFFPPTGGFCLPSSTQEEKEEARKKDYENWAKTMEVTHKKLESCLKEYEK